MSNEILIDNDLARVVDILNQIKKLNGMIELYKSDDTLMLAQYSDMKNRFLLELKELLTDFEIEVMINTKAA